MQLILSLNQHFGIGDSAIYNGHWFLAYKDLNGYLQKVYYVTHFIMVPASLAVKPDRK